MNNCNNSGCEQQSRPSLFSEINEISFVLDELRLYLDTHPNCDKALDMYSKYQSLRREKVDEYTRNYGSIDAYYVNTDNGWSWGDDKMPWEGEC